MDVEDVHSWDPKPLQLANEEESWNDHVRTTYFPVSLKTHGGGEWLESSWLQIQTLDTKSSGCFGT